MEVFGIDGGRTMSSSDLAYELRAPLANVNYHVNELAKSGLIVISHHNRVRGATEHFYCLPGDSAWSRASGEGTANGHNGGLKRTRGAGSAPPALLRAD